MARIDLPDVPDDVHATLAAGAEAAGQPLAAFVVDRLVEITRPGTLADYLATYQPSDTGLTIEDAVAAVRQGRDTDWPADHLTRARLLAAIERLET
ncbi:hypothetical protein ACFQ1S_34515 [Kibdelosporangium lantanae]|uniref:CopG family transcriptional regulator n=1 Tax=Kibdelosporangium lantanae TaxID=1497396 RepID=A0ABW3MIQ6_9PSEU